MAYETRQDVAGKIQWEGGIEEVLDYGLTVDDLPKDDTELREAWATMAAAWEEFTTAVQPVAELLGIDV